MSYGGITAPSTPPTKGGYQGIKAPSPISTSSTPPIIPGLNVPFPAPPTATQTGILPAIVKGAVSGFVNTPTEPQTKDVSPMIYVDAAKNALLQGADALSKQGDIILNNHASTLARGAALVDTIPKTLGTIFGVGLSPLQAMTHIPVVGYAADFVNGIFNGISGGAISGSDNAIQQGVEKGIISQDTADSIKPVVGDIFSLVAQMYAGKLGSDGFAKITDNSKEIMTQLANDPAIKE